MEETPSPLVHAKPSGRCQPVGAFLPLPTSDCPHAGAAAFGDPLAPPLLVARGRLICEAEDTGVLVDLPGDIAHLRSRGAFGILLEAATGPGGAADGANLAQRKRQAVRTDGDGRYTGLQLALSHTEAFFLVYACGVLSVAGLTCAELWRRLCSEAPRFPQLYAAYQHYRSRGWVPKDGAGVGADFLLYAQGPAHFHASYAVLVLPEEPEAGGGGPAASWRGRLAMARVAERSGRRCLLCQVRLLVPAGAGPAVCLASARLLEASMARLPVG